MNAATQRLLRFDAAVQRRRRMRRALGGATLGVAVVCLLSTLPHLARLAGGPAGLALRGTTAVELALGCGFAAAVFAFGALAIRVDAMRLRRAVDRRLGLRGAFSTAMEVLGSEEPIRRLLVSRCAATLARESPRRALPVAPPPVALLVPALLIVAFGLSAPRATPAAGPSADLIAIDARIAEFSDELRAAVARLARTTVPNADRQQTAMRELLDLDAALRRGELTVDAARAALGRWLADRQKARPPASAEDSRTVDARGDARPPTAPNPSDGGAWAMLERLSIAPTSAVAGQNVDMSPAATASATSATSHGATGGTGGTGDGAGRGSAKLGVVSSRSSNVAEHRSTWSLPRAAGPRTDEFRDLGRPAGDRSAEIEFAKSEGAELGSLDVSLTRAERALVKEWAAALARLRATEAPDRRLEEP